MKMHDGARVGVADKVPWLGTAWLGAALGICGAAHAGLSCEGLAAVAPEASTITAAATTAPGTVAGVAVGVTFCRVQGTARPTADSEIKWEVWLPATVSDWNGRMKVNGTGGYAGATPYARLAQDVGDGMVSAGSNMGHDGGESATWTLGHPEKVKDWGLRAHYYVATAAKALSAAYYDRPVSYSYFEGCSNGGRQALLMAQNYPTLFDGIAAGAPSNFYPDLLMWLTWTGKNLSPVAGQPSISLAKRQAITARVLAACDANDGLVDGQITNPHACNFDINTMGPAGDGTLTAAELAVVKAMYAGTTSETGAQRYVGANLGSEADWDPNFADNGGYGPFIGHYVYSVLSPPFNWRTQPSWFSTDYDNAKAALTPITAAPSPDLSVFKARGGKLIQFGGMNDSVVPPDGSIAYLHSLAAFEKLKALYSTAFDQQIDRLTPESIAALTNALLPRVQQYHRLFLLPAVYHCGGSTGPSSIGGGMPEPPKAYRDADHHVVSAVIKWVEQGVAPDQIVATRFDTSGNLVRSRPLCPYPAQAAYKGSGDINVASNFSCAPHPLQPSDVTPGELLLIKSALRQRGLILPNR